jgi:Putative DNA-binding domain/EC042_2821-lke REase
VDDAVSSEGEHDWADFKREFHPSSPAAWCEMVKDIVAMANSGGGFVVIGVEDDGQASTADIQAALKLDPATLTDKVRKYTGVQFGSFSLHDRKSRGRQVLVLEIGASPCPMPFINVGTYAIADNKQKTAFSVGQVYFRHGAKSEPGVIDDFRAFVEREVSRQREEWLGNIRKVVEAPTGSVVSVQAPTLDQGAAAAIPARLVNAPDATPVLWRSPDETHPYRQKEALAEINRRIQGKGHINQFDIQLVRRHFRMDGDPNLVYKPRYGSVQYSPAYVDWVVEEFEKDPEFFHRLRERPRAATTAQN